MKERVPPITIMAVRLKKNNMKDLDFTLNCPVPISKYPHILLGHGSGGRMMQDLLDHIILPILGNDGVKRKPSTDGAIITPPPHHKLVFTTDSFVVNPLVFPGGDIGSLAVHGTINDLAMMGAIPKYLSVALILEEGLTLEILIKVLQSMKLAAIKAGVSIVTGDTKVVEKGHGDGLYITTTGIGFVHESLSLNPTKIRSGDVVIVNGAVGDHGITVMSLRKNMEFGSSIQSDSAALHTLVQQMLKSTPTIHCLRDMTRGGLAAVANELAESSHTCFEIDEVRVPIHPAVASACEMLGLDPLQTANEGKLLAVVPRKEAAAVLAVMKRHPLGKEAAIIGTVKKAPKGVVIGKTVIGSERVIDVPQGELLPRIC